jgi:hypothetical protein
MMASLGGVPGAAGSISSWCSTTTESIDRVCMSSVVGWYPASASIDKRDDVGEEGVSKDIVTLRQTNGTPTPQEQETQEREEALRERKTAGGSRELTWRLGERYLMAVRLPF